MSALFSPALALGVVLSTGYAALFHFWQGGDLGALRRYLLAAWLGFAGGHALSSLAGIHWMRVGQLHVLGGTLAAVAALVIAKLLEA